MLTNTKNRQVICYDQSLNSDYFTCVDKFPIALVISFRLSKKNWKNVTKKSWKIVNFV